VTLELPREMDSPSNLHAQWVWQVYDDTLPLGLVLDSYGVHRMRSMKTYTEELGLI
jgi:hypothetical protein